MAGKKKFSLFDAVMNMICVVFVAEAAAPAAAIGNSQYFWWIFLIIAFLVPYGMIVSELGSTYPDDEGGVYDWVKRAFGKKAAGFTAWSYWVNFPLWIASLALVFPSTISTLTGVTLSPIVSFLIECAFIWIVIFVAFSKASDSAWLMNLGAICKVGLALLLGILGFMYMSQHGNANAGPVSSYFPNFSDTNSITYLSIILFNFMGFEVLATYTDEMESPQKQIPQAIVVSGIAIAVVYLISAFGIGVAIPVKDLSTDSGISDALAVMVGTGSPIFLVANIVFLFTLFGNMVSWSLGVNMVAAESAKDNNLPSFMGYMDPKTGMPNGADITNGVVATILCAISAFTGFDFWVLFAAQIVFLLLAYVPMFPAFLKLRKIDPDRERPFKVPGKGAGLKVITYLPVVLLILSVIATAVPLNGSAAEVDGKMPILILTIVLLVVGVALMAVLNRLHGEGDKATEKA
ncbi:MAG: APC family permease [Parafannyhessea sp.]|uniref:APC family permease n=1 Tax=Parafannyhessea sp. TaxID=2847324 RepID=UPI003EFBCA83